MTPSYFCDIVGRASKEVVPGVRIRTFWQAQMLLSFVDLDDGAVVPLHQHPHEQSGTVISGQMRLTIADETRLLKAGDCYIIPGGVPHTATAVDGPVQVVDVFAPVREDYQY